MNPNWSKNEVEIVIQVNGKVKEKMNVPTEATKDDLERIAIESDRVQEAIREKTVRKVIVVPNKLVNIWLHRRAAGPLMPKWVKIAKRWPSPVERCMGHGEHPAMVLLLEGDAPGLDELYDAFVVEGAEGAIEEFAVARDVAYDLCHEPAYTAADYYRMVHGMFSFLFKTDMLSIIMDIILKVRGL